MLYDGKTSGVGGSSESIGENMADTGNVEIGGVVDRRHESSTSRWSKIQKDWWLQNSIDQLRKNSNNGQDVAVGRGRPGSSGEERGSRRTT